MGWGMRRHGVAMGRRARYRTGMAARGDKRADGVVRRQARARGGAGDAVATTRRRTPSRPTKAKREEVCPGAEEEPRKFVENRQERHSEPVVRRRGQGSSVLRAGPTMRAGSLAERGLARGELDRPQTAVRRGHPGDDLLDSVRARGDSLGTGGRRRAGARAWGALGNHVLRGAAGSTPDGQRGGCRTIDFRRSKLGVGSEDGVGDPSRRRREDRGRRPEGMIAPCAGREHSTGSRRGSHAR